MAEQVTAAIKIRMVSLLSGLLLSILLICGLDRAAAEEKSLAHSTDRLLASVVKKDYDKFVNALQAENAKADDQKLTLDMNQPDSKGKILLVEAARTRDVRFVDALLQYGAFVQASEIPSGVTPLHVAIQTASIEITRELLAYGAKPDVGDKTGRTPRQMVGRALAIGELLAKYDEGGAAAFEDAPGSWTRTKHEKSNSDFWFNNATGVARWNTPPSCAWQRMDVKGQPAKYINSITGQEVTHTPKALAWRYVHMTGHADIWHNWATNISQYAEPAELPIYIVKELVEQKNVRWYNEKTGDISWEDPKYHTHWRQLEDEEGRPFYYNIETAESQYEVPDALAWNKVEDETQPGRFFYHNVKSGESTWDTPDHLAWTLHDSDL